MSFLAYFARNKSDTASIAKERLQIIVAHERSRRNQPEYLADLQKDIMMVIRKYVDIDMDKIEVQLEKNGDYAVLELNVTLPD
ncbi:MAG: cell division topological specificity factor MinE [Marinagarivorans sp.]|nr:cell division topological specificity factor MinE [Marinagarivorans sp.]